MRVLAIDYGDSRTGLAFSDLSRTICGEAFTMNERNPQRAAERIAEEVKRQEVDTLVLGLPLNMNGTEGPRAALCRDFAGLLEEKSGLRPILWDERRSSIEAHAILHANGKKSRAHRKTVDAVAASLLLEGYLDAERSGKGGNPSAGHGERERQGGAIE